MLGSLVKFFDSRVNKFGAPYLTLAIAGLINCPLAYFIRAYVQDIPESESLALRMLATALCLGLLLKDRWPNKLKKFLSLYWFLTVTIALPVTIAYLLLKNNFSLEWLVNASVGLLVTMLVLDWVMSVLSIFIGTMIAYIAFVLQYGHIGFQLHSDSMYLAIYLYAMIVIFCALFARNKEAFYVANRNLLEKMVEEKSDELNKSVMLKNQLITMVTHEVRAPAHVISAVATDLLEGWEKYGVEKKISAITQISRSGQKLFNLVTDWIDATSLSSNKEVTFKMEKHNLLYLINEVTKNVRVLCSEKAMQVVCPKQYKHDDEEYDAYFHEDRIEQVINNLCANAIKFAPEGSKIIIDVCKDTWKKEDGKVIPGFCVSVEDEGVGIGEEDLERVFDAFTQVHDAKNSANVKGVGLGLSISKTIIDGHGGKIWVENNKDKAGCKFSFFIPYNQGNEVKTGEEAGEVEVKSSPTEVNIKRKLNILFLDDEETNCMIGKMMLETVGHKVETFTKPGPFYEALERSASTIDLIILDMIMPTSGIVVIEKIDGNKLYQDIPVLVQSGVFDDLAMDALRSIRKKVEFVYKPYTAPILVEAIDKLLQQEALVME